MGENKKGKQTSYPKLDYSIETSQERNQAVKKIIESTPPEVLTPKYLQILSNYIIFAMDKQEKKKKIINTNNRMITINKREMSFQGLISKFQNGEDGIYHMITNDKNIIFTPKITITEEDVQNVPGLKQLILSIKQVQKKYKMATGKRKYLLKKQLIEMRKDQYILRSSYYQPMYCLNAIAGFNSLSFNDDIQVKNGEIIDNSLISFFNYRHISFLLCYYSKLKEESWGKFYLDGYFLMESLDDLIEKALKKYPLYRDLLIYKIDGLSNLQIQRRLQVTYGIRHSVEYISSLWRNKIPKLIVKEAQKDYLVWYYTYKEKGQWKHCSRCDEIKLANNRFFSKNNTSKDGFYSLCKDCRNNRTKKKKKSQPKIIKRISYKQYFGIKED